MGRIYPTVPKRKRTGQDNCRRPDKIIDAKHNYSVRLKEVGFALGAGYELNSYIRAVTRTIIPAEDFDVASTLFTNYYNFDVQDLYRAYSHFLGRKKFTTETQRTKR
jgi:hypothetical protein